jgi:hypothetical protein
MSGQLAAWVSLHGRGDKAVVDVVRELALASHPDGSSAFAPTWDQLAQGTRTARSTVATALKAARQLGVISEEAPGRGRGRATVYRVNYTLCDPADSCPVCSALASCLTVKVQPPDLNRVAAASPSPRKGPAHAGKGPIDSRKGPAAGPTTDTGTDRPQGGPYPPRESDDRGPLRVASSAGRSGGGNGQPARGGGEPPPAAGGGEAPEWAPGDPASNGAPAPPQEPASNGRGCPDHLRAALYGALGKQPPPRERVAASSLTPAEQATQEWQEHRQRNPQPALLFTPAGLQAGPARPDTAADPAAPGELAAEPVAVAAALAGPPPGGDRPAEAPTAAADHPPGDDGRPEVVPVENPTDVTYADHVLGPCVVCGEGCKARHAVSGQIRHPTHFDQPREGTAA